MNRSGPPPARPGRRRPPHRRGGSLVEMAFVLYLLLSLTFGAVEYGYLFFVKNLLCGAARNGVRAAIPSGTTNADVTAAVLAAMTAGNFPATSYTVTISPPDVSAATVTPGTDITVTVAGPWGSLGVSPLPTFMGGLSATRQVTASAVMAREQ